MRSSRLLPTLALLALGACRGSGTPRPSDAAQTRATTVHALERRITAAAQSDGSSLTLVDEPSLVAPPAAPSGCALERPVRAIEGLSGSLSFATAAAGARALLALSTERGGALWVARSDGTVVPLPAPFAARTRLFAAGADGTLALVFAEATSIAQRARPTIVLVDERDHARAFALDPVFDPTMGELSCERAQRGARCAFAVHDREEFEGSDERRTRFYRFEAAPLADRLTLDPSPTFAGITPLVTLPTAPLTALAQRQGQPVLLFEDGGVRALDPATLELASLGDLTVATLAARAPSVEACQPHAWSLSMQREGRPPTPFGTVDSRPRGARLRGTGARGEVPLALWIDAPQCSERMMVLRAYRPCAREHESDTRCVEGPVALAQATEYDAATDRAAVSIAWREGDRLRWARYRCAR